MSKRRAVLQKDHQSMMKVRTRTLSVVLSKEFPTNTPSLPWKSFSRSPDLIISLSISPKRLLQEATRLAKTEKEITRSLMLFPTKK